MAVGHGAALGWARGVRTAAAAYTGAGGRRGGGPVRCLRLLALPATGPGLSRGRLASWWAADSGGCPPIHGAIAIAFVCRSSLPPLPPPDVARLCNMCNMYYVCM